MSEEEQSFQPTKPFTFPVKHGCEDCKANVEKLQNLMENQPDKYGNKLTIILHQDFWGGNVWHIESVEHGNYERERLEKDLEKAKTEGKPTHGILEAISNLEWF